MWRVLVVAVCLVLSLGASARTGDPPGYAAAKRAFEALDVESRRQIEILLLAAGYGPVNIGSDFSPRLFDAISKLRVGSGRSAAGIIDARDVDRLIELAAPVLAKWDLRPVTLPDSKRDVLVPSGLDLDRTPIEGGWRYSDKKDVLKIQYFLKTKGKVDEIYREFSNIISEKKGVNLRGKEIRGKKFYIRGNVKSTGVDCWGLLSEEGVLVFTFIYDYGDSDFFGRRLEDLLVASLWADLPPGTSLPLPTEASLQRLKQQVSFASASPPGLSDQGTDPPGYAEAKRAFEALDVENRRQLEFLLLAAGYGPIEIAGTFSQGLFEAISKMQAGAGQRRTGIVGPGDVDRLIQLAAPALVKWDLDPLTIPGTRLSTFVPSGLDLDRKPNPAGWIYSSRKRNLQIQYLYQRELGLRYYYEKILKKASEQKQARIVEKTFYDELFFVSTLVKSSYVDFWGLASGNGAVIVSYVYDADHDDFFGSRLENLLVALLWSDLPPGTSLPLPTEASLRRLKEQVSLPGAGRPATPDQATDPQAYAEAKRAFEGLDIENRLQLQVLLLAAGYGPGDLSQEFSKRLFDAIGKMQAETGSLRTGILDDAEVDRLIGLATTHLERWQFLPVAMPDSSAKLWIPFGLSLEQRPVDLGWQFDSKDGKFHADFMRVETGDFTKYARGVLDRVSAIKGVKIISSTFVDGAFTIFSGQGDERMSNWGFADRNAAAGVSLIYDWGRNDFHGDRMELLMADSLWASLRGLPLSVPTQTSMRRLKAALSSWETASSAAPEDSDGSVPTSTFGTGFFVTPDGHVVTNAHVVEGCRSVSVSMPGNAAPSPALVLARDKDGDLALLATELETSHVGRLRMGVRLGEPVAAFGYPLAGLLGTSGNFTIGNVTALSGLGEDSRNIQISVPVQGGNSGGPLVDASGNVVGIVSGKLDALAVAVATGDVPQNVNFAVRASVAATFLESSGIAFETGEPEATLPAPDLADLAKALSVHIVCERS